MIRPVVFRWIGFGLIAYGVLDYLRPLDDLAFHAFYTGLALVIASQALEHLTDIGWHTGAVVHDLRKGTFQDHIINIRWLLDQLHILGKAAEKVHPTPPEAGLGDAREPRLGADPRLGGEPADLRVGGRDHIGPSGPKRPEITRLGRRRQGRIGIGRIGVGRIGNEL